MKLALIPPIDMLEIAADFEYQLMLPHLIDNDRYAYAYNQFGRDATMYVILDNGAAEGITLDSNRLMEIAFQYSVDEIVLPDMMGDGPATRVVAQEFIDEYRSSWYDSFMYVVQGNSVDNALSEALWAAQHRDIDVIGLPRLLTEGHGPFARHDIATTLYDSGVRKPVHLLGASPKYPMELSGSNWPKTVRSTDTSSPFNFAHRNKYLDVAADISRPTDYFNLPWDAFNQYALNRNIDLLKEWTGDL